MNPGFYQHYWDVVGEDVSAFVINCLNTCSFPTGLNDTNVVLIPKKSVPESVADLRPIALCNVVYKIMAKVIANRMKHLLGGLISESQSAFIPNRLITDNILMAAEVGHFLNRKQCGIVGWGALKLDMAKAYDRMEWSFLRRMLLGLGFADKWVDLIMLCVTTVTYNFLINGASSGHLVPTRGLRQGDPLSPYLFIICAEGLSLLLQKAQAEGSIHGCRVARGAPPISHLFFADDSLLFFKANTHEAGVVKHCLELYEGMSGQVVNYHKSSICFSTNTPEVDGNAVADLLGVAQAPNFGKYLGLPAFVGRNKRAAFSYIEDKIKQRICSWNKKLLSQAGKEILLKSVAQSMPTFSMGVFLLPASVCQSIERTMNKYWWGTGSERGIHWKAWDRMCVPKKFGGLGFKELRAFNLAMLGKQAWRFLTMPNSLVARVYKARYFPKTSFMEATLGNNPSYCWRSVMAAHNMICGGVRRRIGDGRSTLIWEHPWLPDEVNPMIQSPMPAQLRNSLVSGLIDEDTNSWDHSILTDLFSQADVDRILKVPISPGFEDAWYWFSDPRGCYSVKSGYRCIVGDYVNQSDNFEEWIPLWKFKVPPKWKTFLWRALNNILPVTTNLLLKRVEVDPECPKCGIEHEDVLHALVLCDFSQLVWHESHLSFLSPHGHTFLTWFTAMMNSMTEEHICFAVAILYHLWRARNKAVWDACLPPPRSVIAAATASLHAWTAVNLHHQDAAMAGPQPAPNVPVLEAVNATPICYFDASYNSETLTATYGAVLVTANGDFIAACAGPLPDCFSPLMAEAMACKEALSWLKDRGELSVELRTDCSQLRSSLCSMQSAGYSYAGLFIQTCRDAMSLFLTCQVSLISRTANVVAHTLAFSAVAQATTLYWDFVPPDSVSSLL